VRAYVEVLGARLIHVSNLFTCSSVRSGRRLSYSVMYGEGLFDDARLWENTA